MTVEFQPVGSVCNLECVYCYERNHRRSASRPPPVNLAAVMSALEKLGREFTLFGGEALLWPIQDLEKIWQWGFQKFGKNSIQTNGSLINDRHMELFKKYKVTVGISMDGPCELNDARWRSNPESTRLATQASQRALERLLSEGMGTGMIVNLHRGNATQDKLPQMNEWFSDLDRKGLKRARLHVLEVEDDIRSKWGLTADENANAFINFKNLEKSLVHLKFDVFSDLRKMLLGEDNSVTCCWKACDPYDTQAVQDLDGEGSIGNCGRVYKQGVRFLKSEHHGFERYLSLYRTPKHLGGCQGCRFFLFCKGQCPGTAMNGNWRNRSEFCDLWFRLFILVEQELVEEGEMPLSLHRSLVHQLESSFIDKWKSGHEWTMEHAFNGMTNAHRGSAPHVNNGGRGHGDHMDHGDSKEGVR